MAYAKLQFPPGVHRNGTAYQSQGRWRVANFVRWVQDRIRPFGGWVREAPTDIPGLVRGGLSWRPSTFLRRLALGSTQGLFLWDDNSILDVTPTGYIEGLPSSIYGAGFGFGAFGAGPFGVPDPSPPAGTPIVSGATTWSLDTWGSNIVAVASHEQIVYEQDGTSALALPVANAPTARFLLATPERILMLFGVTGDDRLIAWSDQENNTLWAPDFNNQAGDFRLQTDGSLQAALIVRGGILVLTTTDAWLSTYIGLPLVYSFKPLARACGLIGPRAVASFDGGAIWMTRGGFSRYGGGQIAPVPCDIEDFIFRDINLGQKEKIHACTIAGKSEVLFFYCSASASEIDRCVSYNLLDGHWNTVDLTGLMPRTTWVDAGAFEQPLAVSPAGVLYSQEDGWTADGVPMLTNRYVESGPVELGHGERVLEATMMLADEDSSGPLQVRFAQQFAPLGPVFSRGPYPVTPYTPIRVTARQVAVRLEATADADFRFGTQRLEVRPGAQR